MREPLGQIWENKEHALYKALHNLVRNIVKSASRNFSALTNTELADRLLSDVWGELSIFTEQSDLISEVIERLYSLPEAEVEVEAEAVDGEDGGEEA